MVFGHKVKYKGVFYPAGVDVPMEEETKVTKTPEPKPEKVETEETKDIPETPRKTPLKRKSKSRS